MAIILDGTNGAFLPTWTTATRPASPANGEIGYNSTTAQLDQYVGGAWSSIPTGSAAAATATTLGTVYGKTGTTQNTYVGYNSGLNTTGNYNSALGTDSLKTNTTGEQITAIGWNSGKNTTGTRGTFVGCQSGQDSTGNDNTGVGNQALQYNTTGYQNTAVGSYALGGTTTGTGYWNTAVGYQAGYNITTDGGITAIGYQALYSNTTGSGESQNVAVGRQAMYTNSIGYYNVAVGYRALYSFNANGGYNTAIGYQAMNAATTAGACTTVGYRSGYSIAGGSGGNTFVGYNAGNNITSGSYNTFIGADSTGAGATDGSEIIVGNNTVGKGSNTGFVNPNGGGVYQGNNSAAWSVASDQRLKKNIVDNTEGLEKISQIRVRNFEYRTADEVTELQANQAVLKDGIQLGVIAQELAEVLPDCVKTESTGVLSVNSDNVFWHMVNAIKDLKAIVDAQAAEIAELKAKVM
jgi:hypothetical protein